MGSKALIVFADGFEDIEAITIVDVLRRGGVGVVTASLNADCQVRSAHGIVMQTDALWADVLGDEYDAIILPGGGEGTENLKKSESLLARLRVQKETGRLVCAICAAPTVLEVAGVLEDEEVTCYPSCCGEMSRRVSNVPVVVDGNVITGQGPGAAMYFALAVLTQLAGEHMAQRVANGMIFDFESSLD